MRKLMVLLPWLIAAAPQDRVGPDLPPARRLEGQLPNRSRWIAEVPARWNGTLILYARGGSPAGSLPPMLAPRGAEAELLRRGYALASGGYTSAGWNPKAAALDQIGALPAVEAAVGRPAHVIALGTSYGGGVAAQEIERGAGQIDGAVLTCGLVVGGIDLMNAQLDGFYAIATLLAPAPIPLVHLHDAAGVKRTADALTAAIVAARTSSAGRARLALAAALMHLPEWHDGTAPPREAAVRAELQARWLLPDPAVSVSGVGFTLGSRLDIEAQAGGNPSFNAGVDYAALLRESASRPLVEEMYRRAGLDLSADLARLTRAAVITADRGAITWMRDTSLPAGAVRGPVLAMQTTGDPVAPPEFLTLYAARVAAAGRAEQLRTVAVARPGHCTFNAGEIGAAADALRNRLESGTWGASVTPAALDRSGGPDSAFVADPRRPFSSRVAVR